MTLFEALKALNDAAYAAIRAGSDTVEHPDLDRQALREIARATDKLVDDNAPVVGTVEVSPIIYVTKVADSPK